MSDSATQPGDRSSGRRGQIATAVADAVDEVPGLRRSPSLLLSTLHPGGRIDGVVLSAERVTVHVVVDASCYGDDLQRIGRSATRAAEGALRANGDGRPVGVIIEDLLAAAPAAPDVVS